MASSPTDTDLQPVAVAERLAESPSPTPQDRWPWYYALFAPAFRPATAARRLAHLSLFQTFLIHLLAAVLFMGLLDVFAGLAEAARDFGREGWAGFMSLRLGGIWSELWSEVVRNPEAAAIMPIAAVGLEIQIALFALLIGLWGARDERVRTSIRNAFRCIWLHSSHALVLLLLLGTIFCVLTAMASAWQARVDLDKLCPWPTYPDPLAAGSSPEQQAEHDRLMKECSEGYLLAWRMRRQLTPWYAGERDEFLMVWGLFPGQWWMLWALLRAVGAPRVVPPLPRPPTCETCGYNLTGTPRGGRCSECGETVESSLGEAVRPGFGWRRGGWLPLAWLRCAFRAVLAPAAVGRQIQVVSRQTDHRLFLVPGLLIAFLIGTSSFLLAFLVSEDSLPAGEVTLFMFIVPPVMGYMTAGGALGLVLLAAGVVGLWYGHGAQRNLCPASMQMAAYVSPVLLPWLLISGVMIVLASAGMLDRVREFLAIREWLSASIRRKWLDPDVWFGIAMFLLAVLSLLLYVRLIARGVAAARYANR